MSLSLWPPWIWYLITATRSISTWIDPAAADDSSVDRLVLAGLICLGFAVLAGRRKDVSRIATHNKWLVVLFIYMALSISWSPFPAVSLVRWIRSVGAFVMVLVVLTERHPLQSLSTLLTYSYYLHLPLSLISIRYFRSIGVSWSRNGSEEMWKGLTMHKNNLGQVAMSSGLLFSWLIGRTRGWKAMSFLFLLMSLWLLGGSSTSRSTTSIVGFGFGICVLLTLEHCRRRGAHVARSALSWALAGALALSAIYVALDIISQNPLALILEMGGRDETFTGRTALWSDILAIASAHSFLGLGFGALWNVPAESELYPLKQWSETAPSWRPGQGHNGYLDLYAELGLAGVLLVTGVVAVAFKKAWPLLWTDYDTASIRLMFLTALLVDNITESSLLKGTHSLWFLFLLFAVNVPSRSDAKISNAGVFTSGKRHQARFYAAR
jgi:exopolysaccharide production protein ExoQ